MYPGNVAYAHILAEKALVQTSVEAPPLPGDQRVNGEAFGIGNNEPRSF